LVPPLPGTSVEDTFKLATDPDWQTAWTDRIEPYLDEYRTYRGGRKIELVKKDAKIAIYSNFFGSLGNFKKKFKKLHEKEMSKIVFLGAPRAGLLWFLPTLFNRL
jgi:hypothetical protein